MRSPSHSALAETLKRKDVSMTVTLHKPSPAFVAASWTALLLGCRTYLVGLFNAGMALNEKGYYFTLLLYGLFSAVSIQKSVRDRAEGIPVTGTYHGLAWLSIMSAITLLAIGLWNATSLALSEKGFYAMAFTLSPFASLAVQKNTRDLAGSERPIDRPHGFTPANEKPAMKAGFSLRDRERRQDAGRGAGSSSSSRSITGFSSILSPSRRRTAT